MKDTLDIVLLHTASIASISPIFIKLAIQLCASALVYVRFLSKEHTLHLRTFSIAQRSVVLTFVYSLAPLRLRLQSYSSPFGKTSWPFPCQGHRSLCRLSCMEG